MEQIMMALVDFCDTDSRWSNEVWSTLLLFEDKIFIASDSKISVNLNRYRVGEKVFLHNPVKLAEQLKQYQRIICIIDNVPDETKYRCMEEIFSIIDHSEGKPASRALWYYHGMRKEDLEEIYDRYSDRVYFIEYERAEKIEMGMMIFVSQLLQAARVPCNVELKYGKLYLDDKENPIIDINRLKAYENNEEIIRARRKLIHSTLSHKEDISEALADYKETEENFLWYMDLAHDMISGKTSSIICDMFKL